MPGFYVPGEYDLAGIAVGAVKQDKVIDGKRIKAGDVILGLKSSGVHSNGFSLVRKVLEVRGRARRRRGSGPLLCPLVPSCPSLCTSAAPLTSAPPCRPQVSGTSLHDKAPWSNESFGLTLLTPTIIYVRDCMKLASIVDVKVRLAACLPAGGRRRAHVASRPAGS